MRFLVISKMRMPAPPGMTVPLIEAMERFIDAGLKSRQTEQVFSLAGYIGGGAILNVGSHEELDTVMSQYPFGPFAETEVYALGDLHHALAESKKAAQQMAPNA